MTTKEREVERAEERERFVRLRATDDPRPAGRPRRGPPVAGPPPRPPLRGAGRAVRRSRPGGQLRPREGGRPLRSRARGAVLDVRDAHDLRRAAPALPRPHLVDAGEPAAQGPPSRAPVGHRAPHARSSVGRPSIDELADALDTSPEEVLEAIEAGATYRAASIDQGPPGGDSDEGIIPATVHEELEIDVGAGRRQPGIAVALDARPARSAPPLPARPDAVGDRGGRGGEPGARVAHPAIVAGHAGRAPRC